VFASAIQIAPTLSGWYRPPGALVVTEIIKLPVSTPLEPAAPVVPPVPPRPPLPVVPPRPAVPVAPPDPVVPPRALPAVPPEPPRAPAPALPVTPPPPPGPMLPPIPVVPAGSGDSTRGAGQSGVVSRAAGAGTGVTGRTAGSIGVVPPVPVGSTLPPAPEAPVGLKLASWPFQNWPPPGGSGSQAPAPATVAADEKQLQAADSIQHGPHEVSRTGAPRPAVAQPSETQIYSKSAS
jgi:hypothetical protein